MFPEEQIHNILHYLLGRHPGSNLAFVSGVGSHEPIPAFGLTRNDHGFIPGGVYSGTNLCLPNYPELMNTHPCLWQQSEYIVFGGSAYIFCVKEAETV